MKIVEELRSGITNFLAGNVSHMQPFQMCASSCLQKNNIYIVKGYSSWAFTGVQNLVTQNLKIWIFQVNAVTIRFTIL